MIGLLNHVAGRPAKRYTYSRREASKKIHVQQSYNSRTVVNTPTSLPRGETVAKKERATPLRHGFEELPVPWQAGLRKWWQLEAFGDIAILGAVVKRGNPENSGW